MSCGFHQNHIFEKTTPCFEIQADIIPERADDQIFVCRKAIGYFFLSPMTAASWVIATIRRESPASDEAAELLYDPLLLNYGGALRDWLEVLVQDGEVGNEKIQTALNKAQYVLDGVKSAQGIVELEPSSAQRTLVHIQEQERNETLREESRKQSVFLDLVTTQTLLYGDRSGYSIRKEDGSRSFQHTDLHTMSTSWEMPKWVIFDPIRLESMLEQFRFEQRTGK